MGRVFLSYRREDSAEVTDRVYAALVERFGHDAVFKDVDSIPLGADFGKMIDDAVQSCDVFLAVIGKDWVENDTGERRLENPDDFVRLEIESAILGEIPIIPLLVRGAKMPAENEIPSSIDNIRFRNAAKVRPDPDFSVDIERISMGIAKILGIELTRHRPYEEKTETSLDDWISGKATAIWARLPKKILAYILILIMPGEITYLSANMPDGTLLLIFGGVGIASFLTVAALGGHLISRFKSVGPKWFGSLPFVLAAGVGLVWALIRCSQTYHLGWWTFHDEWW